MHLHAKRAIRVTISEIGLVKYLLVKTAILRLMPHINAAKNIALLAVAKNQRGKPSMLYCKVLRS